MAPVLALLPSPLLGPVVWRPVARQLCRQGWSVAEVRPADVAPSSPQDALRTFLAALPDDQELVLLPHSNAGLFVPALAAERRVIGYVFADAGLPAFGVGGLLGAAGRVPMAAPRLHAFLAQRADEAGLLPPWTHWWGDEVGAVFPSAEVREQVERQQQRLPLSYFADWLPVPAGWADRPGAYLAFGDGYAAERAAAVARGWPVTTLAGEHLHLLVDPQQVATEIVGLLGKMGIRQPRR